jgi:hypothetical protein
MAGVHLAWLPMRLRRLKRRLRNKIPQSILLRLRLAGCLYDGMKEANSVTLSYGAHPGMDYTV